MKKFIPFLVLSFVLLCTQVFSQTIIGRQLAITVKTNPYGGTANALLWLPQDYTSTTEKYPLIIHLHGIGEIGSTVADLNKLLNTSLPQRIANGFNVEAVNPVDGKLYKFIVVSPQAASWSMEEQQVKYILPDIISKYRIDTNRIYIAGLSAGGEGAWSCITVDTGFCKKLAAVSPMSAAPVANSQNVVNAAKFGVAVWDIIQQNDGNGFTPPNIQYVNTINAASPIIPARITLIPGTGHGAWNWGFDPTWYDPSDSKKLNLYQWMLQYTRDSIGITSNPVAVVADSSVTISLPQNKTSLDGTKSYDSDGKIIKYKWDKISGPSQFMLSQPDSSSTDFSNLQAGAYKVALTVTDDKGSSGSDTVSITVNTPENILPVANAGNDTVIVLPENNITFDATSSYDPDGSIMSYHWNEVSGKSDYSISNTDSSIAIVSNLSEGQYMFELSVTDDGGDIAKDTIQVTVDPAVNIAPIANAGLDTTLTLPEDSIILDGSKSYDTDGNIVSYEWSEISGNANFTISAENSVKASVSNLIAGAYYFQIKVTDDKGSFSYDTIIINELKNILPVANAGNDVAITLPVNNTLMDGTLSNDPDGSIVNYHWSEINGDTTVIIANSDSVTTIVSNLLAGNYLFELAVTDNDGEVAKDTLSVTVNPEENISPIANAGDDTTIKLPINDVLLDGSNSSDADGNIISYQWTKISGADKFFIDSSNDAKTLISNLDAGTYLFELSVTDNKGASGKDTVQVIVNPANISPVANAGSDINIQLPDNDVNLTATLSKDEDGKIVSYAWNVISGNPGFTLINPDSVNAHISGLLKGDYVVELTVTDNDNASNSDTINIHLDAPINIPPIANAGNDIILTLPKDSTFLIATASKDIDGNIVSYLWQKISGPAKFTIGDSTNAETKLFNLVQGYYVFKLTVLDDQGASSTDTIKIVEQPLGTPNKLPIVKLPKDVTLTLPNNSVVLDGSASHDADGQIVTYKWEKISGPNKSSFSNSDSSITLLSGLIEGSYYIKFTITDNEGGQDSGIVNIVVVKANKLPIAIANKDVVITLPQNTYTLNGSMSKDYDGKIINYKWDKIYGPLKYVFADADSSITEVSQLIAGSYQFRLTVIDDDGAKSSDTVNVTVNKENKFPLAKISGQTKLTLPLNSTILDGSISFDPDGNIVSYKWKKITGPEKFIFSDATKNVTNFSNLEEGIYIVQLTVTDNNKAETSDTIEITVIKPNIPPVAKAPKTIYLTLPSNSTNLDGTGSYDIDGTITKYLWQRVSGPYKFNLTDNETAIASVKDLIVGTYQFKLTVTDNDGEKNIDTVNILVEKPNKAPVAKISGIAKLTLPVNTTVLDGSSSYDPDGKIVSYKWKKISGPVKFTLSDPDKAVTTFSNLVEGVYQVQLTVTDDDKTVQTDEITITVSRPNKLPIAKAVKSTTITLPENSVNLDGSSSTDPDGNIVSYKWDKLSGPFKITFVNPNNASATVKDLIAGIYQIRLTVTDNDGGKSSDTITITVNKENKIPIAKIISKTKVMLPDNGTTLDGSLSHDPDGTIVNYKWKKISGPGKFTFSNNEKPVTQFSDLIIGVYKVELTVTDNNKAEATDIIEITVVPSDKPVAKAGDDIYLLLPKNKAHLDANGSYDPNGQIVNYKWRKMSGPSKFNFTNNDSSGTSLYNLVPGVYYIELTVTDNDKNNGKDTVKITVRDPNNICGGKRIYLDKRIDNTVSVDGATFQYQPGDTLVLRAKNNPYSITTIQRIHGTTQCPVIITNEGGQIQFTNRSTAITIRNCTHVKLLGTGSEDAYGISITNSCPDSAAGAAVQIDQRSADVEVSNVYIQCKSVAFWVKQEMECADSLQYPNWVIDSIFIHDNICKSIRLEGMYLGSTDPNSTDPWRYVICNGDTLRPKTLRLGDIYVYNNFIDSTGRSGIQLSSASTGKNKIYNNTVMHSGFEFNSNGQGNGISIGGYTHAEVYNNTVRNTYTNGISCFGSGLVNIHDNNVDSSGVLANQTVPLIANIMIDTRPTNPVDSTLFYVTNNTLTHNSDYSIRVYKTYPTFKKGNIVCNNIGNVMVDPNINWTKNCSGRDVDNPPSPQDSEPFVNGKQLTFIYPNPATDVLFVNIGKNLSGKLSLSIFDEQGRLIQTQTLNKTEETSNQILNIKTLQPGFYVLQIAGDKQKQIIKFIKSKF